MAMGAASCLAQAPDNSKPSIANVANAQYPRVSPDGRITFRVKAPDAQKVAIEPLKGNADTGDNGMGKDDYEMTKDKDGYWTVTTPPIVPGFHYYTVLIDGNLFVDPSTETFFGAGRELSAVEVPDADGGFFLPKDVPQGEIRAFWYHSKLADQWRRIYVYTPPGYDSNPQQRYPVLYLRHGGGEDETGWVKQGHVSAIMDNLIAAGKTKSMLVVMESGSTRLPGAPQMGPQGGQQQPPQGAAAGGPPQGQNGPGQNGPGQGMMNLADKLTIQEVIPAIDARYRTIADREHRAIGGLSMGAGQALSIGIGHLDTFSAIAGMSRPPMRNFDVKTAYNGAMADTAAFNKKVHVLFFGAATEETGIFNSMKESRAALDKAGIKYTYVEYPGLAHEWQNWRKQLRDYAPLLFQW